MTYECIHCRRTFASPYGLKRHISAKHQYINAEGSETSHSNLPPVEAGLWDDDSNLPTVEAGLWDDDFIMDEPEPTIESHEETRFTEIVDEENEKRNETDKEIGEEIWEEIDDNLTYRF
jgi:hypothetical protein